MLVLERGPLAWLAVPASSCSPLPRPQSQEEMRRAGPRQGLQRPQTTRGRKAKSRTTCYPDTLAGGGAGLAGGQGPSVLLVPSLPPGVDELPEEQLAAQGTPGVLGVATTGGEAVGVHHATVGQGVYLEAQGQQSAGTQPPTPWESSSLGPAGLRGGSPGWTTMGQGQLCARCALAWGTRGSG